MARYFDTNAQKVDKFPIGKRCEITITIVIPIIASNMKIISLINRLADMEIGTEEK